MVAVGVATGAVSVGVGQGGGTGRIEWGGQSLGGFLNKAKTAIRGPVHEEAITSLLHLTVHNNPQGIFATLGFGKHTQWVNANMLIFFSPQGPLLRFNVVLGSVL